MNKRRVWRYSCEFCKKSNCSAASISKHEERCTLNPARVCGMCKMVKHPQANMPDLLALLPNPETLEIPSDEAAWEGRTFTDINGSLAAALPLLRAKSHNCPACILAALRQKKIPVPMVTEFNYTDECKAVWAVVNEETERYGY